MISYVASTLDLEEYCAKTENLFKVNTTRDCHSYTTRIKKFINFKKSITFNKTSNSFPFLSLAIGLPK